MRVVAEEARRPAVSHKEDVEIAVAVDIGMGCSATNDRAEEIGTGGLRADSNKTVAARTAGIPEELGGLSIGFTGLNSLDIAFEMAIRGKKIEPPIEIVVEEEEAKLHGRLGR